MWPAYGSLFFYFFNRIHHVFKSSGRLTHARPQKTGARRYAEREGMRGSRGPRVEGRWPRAEWQRGKVGAKVQMVEGEKRLGGEGRRAAEGRRPRAESREAKGREAREGRMVGGRGTRRARDCGG